MSRFYSPDCPECDIEDGACAKCGNYCPGCGVSLDLECRCCSGCKKLNKSTIKPPKNHQFVGTTFGEERIS